MHKRFMCRNGILCLILFFICLQQMHAMDHVDKQRLEYGMQAAKAAADAMKAVKFVSWIAKVGSAAGAVLAVVSIVLDIVLMFLNIESPEMIEMKFQFNKLNGRLDSLSQQFQEVKRQIDWSAVQLKYAKHELAIRALIQDRNRISQAKTKEQRDEAIEMFKSNFRNGFDLSAESLLDAMTRHSTLNNNIFLVAGRYTHQHPENVFHFMKGSTQLLIQGFSLKATYIKLQYKSEAADEYFQSLVKGWMKEVTDKARSVYNNMQNNWQNQMRKDVVRFAVSYQGRSHGDYANNFFDYITKKFVARRWFVVVYNDIWTYEEHAAAVCGGGHFFRHYGRNIVIASYPVSWNTGWSPAWGYRVMDSVGHFRQDHDGAGGLMNRIQRVAGNQCGPMIGLAIAKTGSGTHVRASDNRVVHRVKSVQWCNTNLCWVKKDRHYDVHVFG